VVTSVLESAWRVLNILAISLLGEHLRGVLDFTMGLLGAGGWSQATKGCTTRQLNGGVYINRGVYTGEEK